MSGERPILGIDLGTSNTSISFVDDDEVRVITDERGRGVTPSVVCLNRYGEFVVGHFAKAQMITNPHSTLYSAKRLLGVDFDSPDLQESIKHLNFPVVDDGNNMPVCRIMDRFIRPFEVSAEVLRKVKGLAENYLKMPVTESIITVPAHFTDRQRKETLRAAELAGLEVLRLINEPTAAALAYGYGFDKAVTVVVYDFGGGTFDISVLEIDGGIFEVLATGGDTYLGGDDINNRLCEHIVAQFLSESGIDLRRDKMAMQRVLDSTEKAKIELSEVEEAIINLPRIAPNIDFNAHLYHRMTREDLEYLCGDLVDKTLDICRRVCEGARIDIDQIDDVLLVGGQTRMPLVKHKVAQFFGREPNDSLDPDYVVAVGAAIQGHTLISDDADVILLDVIPVGLGLESLGGVFTELVPKNSKLPYRVSRVFTTTSDYQEEVRIKVFQGEHKYTAENTFLGELVLSGVRQALRREPQIEVTFRIDTSGVLHVSAADLDTGDVQQIQIQGLLGGSTTPQVVGGSSERGRRPLDDSIDRPGMGSSSRSLDAFGLGGSQSRSLDNFAQSSGSRSLDAFGIGDSGARRKYEGSGSRSMDAFGLGAGDSQSRSLDEFPATSTGVGASTSGARPYFGLDSGETSSPFPYEVSNPNLQAIDSSHSGESSNQKRRRQRLSLEPGTIISGRYELLEQVGAGAFGAVYKAKQLGIDRTVAIKLLLPEVTKVDNTAIQRFEQEAKLSASLEHPNTITIHDYGQTEDEMLFLVMEFVRGRTLQQVLREEGALDPVRCLPIIKQVLASLHEAHSLGVVHRDMKPGNIMLYDRVGARDVVKVLDFGIAKLISDAKKNRSSQDLTMAGRIVGTPRYMAPEQVKGKGAFPASDIYSLGLIFYAMLTGRKAVRGGSTVELIAAQISHEAVIDEHDPRVPPALMGILRTATAKQLTMRYVGAEEMLADLDMVDLELLSDEAEDIRARARVKKAESASGDNRVDGGGDPDGSFFGRLFKKR